MAHHRSRSKTDDLAPTPIGSTDNLRKELARRKKAELVDLLVGLAGADRQIFRRLNAKLDVAPPPGELIAATRQAIADATAFDKREINRNFSYNHQAYSDLKRNLNLLIGLGQLREALPLGLELMKRGSYQVEMSDEGQMTDEIEEGLNVIFEALRGSDLPSAEAIAWCSSMLEADGTGFIGGEPLQSLRTHFQTIAKG